MARQQAQSSGKPAPNRQGSGGKAAREAQEKGEQVSIQKNENSRHVQNQGDKDKQAHTGAAPGRKKH
jgi:hypothetical protein